MTPGNPYRPSNGTEGFCFMEDFCWRCKRDAKYRETDNGEDGCPILADTFVYETDDPKYPKEWIYNERGFPCCTAFDPEPEDEEPTP